MGKHRGAAATAAHELRGLAYVYIRGIEPYLAIHPGTGKHRRG